MRNSGRRLKPAQLSVLLLTVLTVICWPTDSGKQADATGISEASADVEALTSAAMQTYNAAQEYFKNAQWSAAVMALQQAIEQFAALEDWLNAASASDYLARAHQAQNNITAAIQAWSSGREFLEKVDADNDYRAGLESAILANLLIWQGKQGHYQDVSRHAEQLDSILQDLDESVRGLADSVAKLQAIPVQERHELHSAQLQKAEAKLARLSSRISQYFRVLGNTQIELGLYERAQQSHQRSLELAQKQQVTNSALLIRAHNDLGLAYAAQADRSRYAYATLADEAFQQSLALAQEHEQRDREAEALYNLANLALTQEQYQEAIDRYQAVLSIAQELNDPRLEAYVLLGLGVALTHSGEFEQAHHVQAQALEDFADLQDPVRESFVMSNDAYTDWQRGDLETAESKMLKAIQLRESLRSDVSDFDKVSLQDTHAHAYYLLQQILIEQDKTAEALEITERSRARAFVELLRERQDSQMSLLPSIQQLQQIAKEEQATLVQYAVIPDETYTGLGKLKGRPKAIYIWVIQPDGSIDFQDVAIRPFLRRFGTLERLVKAARCADGRGRCEPYLRSRGGANTDAGREVNATAQTPAISSASTRQHDRGLRQAYDLLVAPIENYLPTDPEAPVILIPHDVLFMVPFAALQDDNGDYLIENHTLLTAPSIQAIALSSQQTARLKQQKTKALVVGNPTMPPGQGLAPLPGAEQEAKAIGQLLKTEPWLGSTATEAALVEALPNYNWIHLATHGLLDYKSSDRDRLPGALAFTESEQADGFLTSHEIAELNLQAMLVVLSACDTGRGELTGDGIFGLSRAWFSAGAANLIVSLWAVPDAPTAALMTAFYQNLEQDQTKAQALRQAMLQTLEQFPDPRDWSAFTLVGNVF